MKKTVSILMLAMMAASLAACSPTTTATTAAEVKASDTAGSTDSQKTAPSASANSSIDNWPEHAITIIIGFSAGSGTDLGARYMASALEKVLGVSVVVENNAGSGSWIAWNQVMYNSGTDGYTVGLINHNFPMGVYNTAAIRKETLDDVQLLVNQVLDSNVLAIRSNENRFTDVASFIDYSKENDVMIAVQTVGITDGDATCAEWFRNTYGSKIITVPVDSAAEGLNMFKAGDVDVFFGNVGDVYVAHNEGEMKAVCQFSEKRSEFLPDVPTITEAGFDEYIGFSARGYFYPQGVDPAIVEKMQDAMMLAMEDPDYQENMTKLGLGLMPMKGDDFYNLLASQLENRKKVWNIQ